MPVLQGQSANVDGGVEYNEVVDTLFAVLNNAINDCAVTLLGYMPEARWPGNPEGESVPMEKLWIRPSVRIVMENQSSLSNDLGRKRYEGYGLLFVQLFAPRQVSNTLESGRRFAQAIRNAYRKPSGVDSIWFRNQRVDELPPTTENYPFNVVVEFHYTTIL